MLGLETVPGKTVVTEAGKTVVAVVVLGLETVPGKTVVTEAGKTVVTTKPGKTVVTEAGPEALGRRTIRLTTSVMMPPHSKITPAVAVRLVAVRAQRGQ